MTNIHKSKAAQELAAMRRKVTGRCVVCGGPIEGTTRRQYCSNACKVRAHRQRQREKRQGPQTT